MLKMVVIAVLGIALVGCAQPSVSVDGDSQNYARASEFFAKNVAYLAHQMEEKYADNHCGSEIQHGCWGTVTLLSETAAVFPKYKKLEQYIPIAFSKRGRHHVEAVQVLDNSDWFYMASVTPSNNSAVKIEVADAENLLREEVIVGTYQSSYRRVVPRKARISGFAKLTGGPEFISLNMKKEEGDIGAPVVTENGEYIGMIVKSPFGGDTKGVRYALPASTIIASVRNSFWYQEQ